MKQLFCVFAMMLASTSGLATNIKSIVSGDAAFLDNFSNHHRSAIEMGKLALSKATNSKLKNMAGEMVDEQEQEVALMTKWRNEKFPDAAKSPPAPKMDMDALKKPVGREFDLAFLQMMQEHHAAGIRMAREASKTLKLKEIRTFAKKAADDQKNEIERMKALAKAVSSTM